MYSSIKCPTKKKSARNINSFVKRDFVKRYNDKMLNVLESLFNKKTNSFNFSNHFSNIEFCCIIMSWPSIFVNQSKRLLAIGWQFDFGLVNDILQNKSVIPLIDYIDKSLAKTNALFKFIRLFFLQQMLCNQFQFWYNLCLKGKKKMYVFCFYFNFNDIICICK